LASNTDRQASPEPMRGERNEAKPTEKAEPTQSLGKWIAVVASIIALVPPLTSAVSGYWQAETAKQRGEQDLALADLKERSNLASEYLRLIIAKDTAFAERITLLDALSAIDKHPLQEWAKQRQAAYRDTLVRSEAAFRKQQEAAQAKEGAEQQEAMIRADIERLEADMNADPNNLELRDRLRSMVLIKYQEIGRVRSQRSIAEVRIEDTRTTVSRIQQGIITPAVSDSAEATITEISDKITATRLKQYFPPDAARNIEIAAPYLKAALEEFKITNKRLGAAIIATVAVESPLFESYEESVEQGKRWEGRRDLGNTQDGDGVKYRGRGYIGITGKANYQSVSVRLGLGSRLVDSPEDARLPEIAARVLVAYFVQRQPSFERALEADNLGHVRRLVYGGPDRIDQFTTAYRKILADL
jgi:predicted chitinase